jgi:uncharacterized protein YjbJ (UPF0337 family)
MVLGLIGSIAFFAYHTTNHWPLDRRSRPSTQEATMDKQHVKGAADKAKGSVKEAAGKLTGDKKMQAEGKLDKAKGDARKAVGDVKDAVRDAKKH